MTEENVVINTTNVEPERQYNKHRYLKAKDVKGTPLQALFDAVRSAIGTKKQTVNVTITYHDSVELREPYWDGGSKDNDYTATIIILGNDVRIDNKRIPQFVAPEGERGGYPRFAARCIAPTTPGCCVLHTGTFCGKESTPTITINAKDARSAGLTQDEHGKDI